MVHGCARLRVHARYYQQQTTTPHKSIVMQKPSSGICFGSSSMVGARERPTTWQNPENNFSIGCCTVALSRPNRGSVRDNVFCAGTRNPSLRLLPMYAWKRKAVP
eukprot:357541-Amphidinium_carterae.1